MTTTITHSTFRDYETIYENRHQYNLEWAYEDAQEKLDEFKSTVIEGTLEKKCSLCKGKFDGKLDSLKIKNRKEMKRHRWYARIFSNIYNILSYVEVALSVALVMVISSLSHTGEEMAHVESLGIWIGLTFAFMKVYIEKYFLRPWLDRLGWKMYLNSFERLTRYAEEISDQATEMLEEEIFEEKIDGLELITA